MTGAMSMVSGVACVGHPQCACIFTNGMRGLRRHCYNISTAPCKYSYLCNVFHGIVVGCGGLCELLQLAMSIITLNHVVVIVVWAHRQRHTSCSHTTPSLCMYASLNETMHNIFECAGSKHHEATNAADKGLQVPVNLEQLQDVLMSGGQTNNGDARESPGTSGNTCSHLSPL
jgi:hypothetical protein